MEEMRYLIYLNNDEHTHMNRVNGSTDLLDMAFVSPNLAKHDSQSQIVDAITYQFKSQLMHIGLSTV